MSSVNQAEPLRPVRPVVIGVCPVCGGQGHVPAASFERTGIMVRCMDCGGCGDLDAFRLHLAYEVGRQEILAWLRGVSANTRTPTLTVDELRSKVSP